MARLTMRILSLICMASCLAVPAVGQDADEHSSKVLSEPTIQRWKIGILVTAENGPAKGIFASTPVPVDWPEQSAKLIESKKSSTVRRVNYRNLAGGVRQMVIEIPRLPMGQSASAWATYEVTKKALFSPDNTDRFVVPLQNRRKWRKFLGPSPYIESDNPSIRSITREIVADRSRAWEQVEAIYEWVRANVEYRDGPLKGALAAFHDRDGDCEELTSLFIAMCRANRIPARTVWVPGHCYPEFFLKDEDGKGHWFSCQAAGSPAFGSITEMRPILQKGDNFRVPGDPRRQTVRYAQTLGSLPGGGNVHPVIKIVHERVKFP